MVDQGSARRIRGLDAEQRRMQRRDQILVAAKELFATNGFFGTTIEQLSQTAFVSTKSFYESFTSREDCYVQLYEKLSHDLMNDLASAVAHLPATEDAAAAALLDAFIDILRTDLLRAHLLLGRGRLVLPEVDVTRTVNRRWAAEFVEAQWRTFGLEGEHHAIAVALVGGIFDVVTMALLDPDPRALEGARHDLAQFYFAVRRGL